MIKVDKGVCHLEGSAPKLICEAGSAVYHVAKLTSKETGMDFQTELQLIILATYKGAMETHEQEKKNRP